MLFNSYIFILAFLPLTLLGYYLCNHYQKYKLGIGWLCLMSFCFYGYFHMAYLCLLLASIFINFWITRKLHLEKEAKIKKIFLILGLVFNLGILFYYKYYDFFVGNLNEVFGTSMPLLKLLLPLGISFFTFQQLSFVIDTYQGKAPRYTLLTYTSYVTFFPQLIAGPIVLHDELIVQFEDQSKKKFCFENMLQGIYGFSLGLGKKVLLADTFSKFVNIGFGRDDLNAVNAMIAMVCYSLQIYFDFSGYCDMAYGIGYMFNIRLPWNFHSPYKAANIAEFWDRWHMTLTRFFTRYLYIPLGGSRKGTVRTYVNTMIVFLVSGLWHGANWTFVLWGAINGLGIVCYKAGRRFWDKIPRGIGILLTFLFSTCAWTLFRSPSIGDGVTMIATAFTGGFGSVLPEYAEAMNRLAEIRILARFGLQSVIDTFPLLPLFLMVTTVLLVCFLGKNTQEKMLPLVEDGIAISEEKQVVFTWTKLMVTIVLFTWSVVSLSEISEFLYFNF